MNEPVHIRLKFNDMVMSVCNTEDEIHKDAKFWLPWGAFHIVESFCKMNQIRQIDNKRVFGTLLAGRIIQLCL